MNELYNLDISNTDIDSGYLPDSVKYFYCSTDKRKDAKVKIIEQEWEYFDWDLKKYREFINSPNQKWLNEEYPREERDEITKLDINSKELKGFLYLKGFTNLKELDCSNNQLTNLVLLDCPNLETLICNNNKITTNLDFLKSVNELEKLNISNCPTEGSLKPLQNLNKLEVLDISNTNLSEGLEYLPESCEYLICNSDYQHKSIELTKELDKSNCSKEKDGVKYYIPAKWREDKQNKMISNIITLERLFVIRGNLKQFLKKWGQKTKSSWLKKIFNQRESNVNELGKLQSPQEFNNHKYWSIPQWTFRTVAVGGGVVAGTVNLPVGIAMVAAPLLADGTTTWIKENLYDAQEKKWSDFLEDADTFLDNFHELLGILAPVEIKKLLEGKVSVAVKELSAKTEKFLSIYDEDKNKEISIDELIKERDKLAQDLNLSEEKSKTWGIVNAIKKLETEIIKYRKPSYGIGEGEVKTDEGETGKIEQLELENQTLEILKLQKRIEEMEESLKYYNDTETTQKLQVELTDLKIKLAVKKTEAEQAKKEKGQLEKEKKDLETQLQEAEVNYQQIKKELFEKQNNLIFLQEQGQSVSEELKLLGQKITELRQDLVQSEKNKNNLKKQLIQAEVSLFKYQVKNLNLYGKINQGWTKTCECIQDCLTNIQTKMNTPIYYWEACCEKPTKIDKGKEKEVIVIVDNSLPEQEVSSEQVGETSLSAQIQIPLKNK